MVNFLKSFVSRILLFDRVSVSEGIKINKNGSDILRVCYLCSFYFFKDKNFSYQPYVCDSCLELTRKVTQRL